MGKRHEKHPLGELIKYKEPKRQSFWAPCSSFTVVESPQTVRSMKSRLFGATMKTYEDTELSWKYLLNDFPEMFWTCGEYHTKGRHTFINSLTSSLCAADCARLCVQQQTNTSDYTLTRLWRDKCTKQVSDDSTNKTQSPEDEHMTQTWKKRSLWKQTKLTYAIF